MILIGLDVISLYTSIRYQNGLRACMYFLRARSLNLLYHTEMLLFMIKYCLDQNYFMFHDKYYMQQRGIAVGSAFAPNLANLLMGWWEEQFVSHMEEFNKNVLLRLRFIDDLFI